MDKKQRQFSIWYVFIALWAMMLFQLFVTPYFNPTEIPYSEFKGAVASDKVEEVAISSMVIHGKMKPDKSSSPDTPSWWPVPAETPALAMTRSSRPAPVTHASIDDSFWTSSTFGWTTALRASQAAVVPRRRSGSRPERCSVTPGAASSAASAAPRPEEAPVIRTDWGSGMPTGCLGFPARGDSR